MISQLLRIFQNGTVVCVSRKLGWLWRPCLPKQQLRYGIQHSMIAETTKGEKTGSRPATTAALSAGGSSNMGVRPPCMWVGARGGTPTREAPGGRAERQSSGWVRGQIQQLT